MDEQPAPEPTTPPTAPDGFTQVNGLPAVPIVIGVVGHRGLSDEVGEAVKKKLKDVFRQFKETYPHTPLVVMSALAEGADQVAARAALDPEVGAFVRAPLPFPPAIYRQSTSFDTEPARKELDDLLGDNQVEWFVVPLPEGTADKDTDWLRVATDQIDEKNKKLRHTCYANAGGHLTRRCHVLIALWDERDQGRSRGPSGTAEYVAFKLNGRPPSHFPWAFAEPLGYRNDRRLVMVIDTPRADPAPPAGPGDIPADRPVGEPQLLVPNDDDERWAMPGDWWPLPGRIGSLSRFGSRVKAALGFHPVSSEDDSPRRLRAGSDLLLLPSLMDVNELPTYGTSLIIVAVVEQVLHFRIFDSDGQMVVDTNAKNLRGQAGPIVQLRKRLESLWPPHVITADEKAEVIDAVTWIVSHPLRLRIMKAELRQFRETCTNVDDFNRDLAREPVERDIRRRLENEAELRAPHLDEQHNHWLLRLSRIREAAASLSGNLQPQQDGALLAVLVLLGLAVVAFHFYAHLFGYDTQYQHTEHNPRYLVAFLILLFTAMVIVVADWWTRLDERRLDSRALAEALRVRRAWSMAGIGKSVADSYSGQIRNEMSWIRQALLHVCPPPQVWVDQFSQLTTDQKLDLLECVRNQWVKEQIEQHKRGHEKQHEAAMYLRRSGFGLAVMGWVILVGVLFSDRFEAAAKQSPAHAGPHDAAKTAAGESPGHAESKVQRAATPEPPLSPRYPRHWVVILASSLVITGGLCIAFCERRAHEELSKQYERMAILFANGDRELGDRLAQRDIIGAQRVIESLGHEAIVEHAQWLILRRARQLELHIGG